MTSFTNRIKSWFSDENKNRRRSPRCRRPLVVAHFWTGGAPQPIIIRDISTTGFFLLTEERWYVGTIVRMTLQRLDCDAEDPDQHLTVQSRVVRIDTEGVAFEFALAMHWDGRSRQRRRELVTEQERMESFLSKVSEDESPILAYFE
jgi:hypothetical protein